MTAAAVFLPARRTANSAKVCVTAALRRQRAAVLRPAAEPQVEQRCLAGYDAVLGAGSGAAR
jgi:hypothetical protein